MKKHGMMLFQCFIFALVVSIVYFGIVQSDQVTKKESTTQLEGAIQKALTQSYSISGQYPKTLEQLIAEYKLYVDEGKYMVHYIFEGDNIRPEVLIMRKDSAYEK